MVRRNEGENNDGRMKRTTANPGNYNRCIVVCHSSQRSVSSEQPSSGLIESTVNCNRRSCREICRVRAICHISASRNTRATTYVKYHGSIFGTYLNVDVDRCVLIELSTGSSYNNQPRQDKYAVSKFWHELLRPYLCSILPPVVTADFRFSHRTSIYRLIYQRYYPITDSLFFFPPWESVSSRYFCYIQYTYISDCNHEFKSRFLILLD